MTVMQVAHTMEGTWVQVRRHYLIAIGAAALVLGGVAAAVVGAAVYSAALLLWRPRGLRAAWAYVRELT